MKETATTDTPWRPAVTDFSSVPTAAENLANHPPQTPSPAPPRSRQPGPTEEATPRVRLDAGDREHWTMASYAMHSRDTAGRIHDEPPHPYRGPFVRDRDRILHSSAFRRLSGKMQVFTGEMGIYHRTRLTHTLEVASVARTIARVLRLNEDLTEALALMHDVGHPPFGHCGEDVLCERMKDVGGFSHNQFALTIVTELERRYEGFAGLNLSREMLAGQDTRADKAAAAIGRSPLLEVQIVDLADSIAYDAHDVDDAIQMGLLNVDQLSELAIVRDSLDHIRDRFGMLRMDALRQSLVRTLIEGQVSDLLGQAVETLRPYEGYRSEDIRAAGIRVTHSEAMADQRRDLERYLFDAVYRHDALLAVRHEAAHRLGWLYDELAKRPDRLPMRFRQRMETVAPTRVIGEYLAGMTDAFCNAQYAYMKANSSGPLADW